MYRYIKINHTLKKIILQVIHRIRQVFCYVVQKFKAKPSIHDHYKCKINNQKAVLSFQKDGLLIKHKKYRKVLPYNKIQQVALKEKWWCIRVQLIGKEKSYNFDLPSYKKANKLYEQLIYKKVESKL